jgi:hypothetical protein
MQYPRSSLARAKLGVVTSFSAEYSVPVFPWVFPSARSGQCKSDKANCHSFRWEQFRQSSHAFTNLLYPPLCVLREWQLLYLYRLLRRCPGKRCGGVVLFFTCDIGHIYRVCLVCDSCMLTQLPYQKWQIQNVGTVKSVVE